MNKNILLTAVSLCCSHGISAAAVAGPTDETHWQLTPYLWAAGLNATLSPFRRAPELSTQQSFSDIIDNLNAGGFINLWVRHNRLVFFGDAMFTDTSNREAVGPLPAMQLPGFSVTIPAGASTSARLDSQQWSATLLGGYRLLDEQQFSMDVLAGTRLWHISNKISVRANHPLIGTYQASHKESFSWADPIVAARVQVRASEQLSLLVQGDIGGHAGKADSTWSLLAAVRYQLPSQLSVLAGYKVIDVDYHHDDYIYNARLGGPAIGLSYRF
ncbi:hypothetical protein [Oceanimonas smirnovii]|uniref:hypothetical protein n=1 Tax=Oceanimonas smirnovii TaxID=264574 RepID=UPI003FD074A5